MRKIISCIVIIFFSTLCITVHGENEIDFKEKNIDKTVYWSGREWITDTYPPQISRDAIEFSDITGNDEVKSVLKNYNYIYAWTGSDYLVYQSEPDYRKYDKQKYLYRLSEDFGEILNEYEVPNWITDIAFADGEIFISTKNVYPKLFGETVLGIRYGDYGIFHSKDCTEWTQIECDEYSMTELNNKVFIGNDIYSNGNVTSVIYEIPISLPNYKLDSYLCRIDNSNENDTVLAISADGIYWDKLAVNKINRIQKVSEIGDDIVITYDLSGGHYATLACEKQGLFSQVQEQLTENPIYVQYDGNILAFEQPPVIQDDRTLIPLRFLFEQMGAEVTWNQEEQTATITQNDTAITVGIDDTEAEVNGQTVSMDVPAQLINDKTMVPVRFLSEELGYDVNWDGENRIITIE